MILKDIYIIYENILTKTTFIQERESFVGDKERSIRDLNQLYAESKKNEEVLE